MGNLEQSISEDGAFAIITLGGEIDLEQSSRMRESLLGVVADHDRVIVDMAAVNLIDSSGIANLLEAFQTARKRGKSLVLAAVGADVLRVLKLARLDSVFVIADDVETAKRMSA